MIRAGWKIRFGILLVLVSLFIYSVHYLTFHDLYFLEKYTFFYLGLIPLEAVIVTLILDQLLEMRERRERLEKMNMVIGAFFSEVGTRLLTQLSDADPGLDQIKKDLVVTGEWSDREFHRVSEKLKTYNYRIDPGRVDIKDLKTLLTSRRDFLVRLLENPILLEHQLFTSLLMAVFHLTEELGARKSLDALPDTDLVHLSADMKRAYVLLAQEWLDYMQYLKHHYPYLFSLAMRTNPFDETATPVVHR